jgi:hypothetical protein
MYYLKSITNVIEVFTSVVQALFFLISMKIETHFSILSLNIIFVHYILTFYNARQQFFKLFFTVAFNPDNHVT